MTGPKAYHWLHIPTGITGMSEFSEEHAIQLGVHLFANGCLGLLPSYELINKWNAQQPLEWKYWL